MRLTEYTGQDLKGDINHYSIIEPIVCLVGKNPNDDLQHFFDVLGWGNRKKFSCSGNFEHDMRLFIDNQEVSNLETWFVNYCKIALR